ncbi:MAG TPA: MFS transporter [Nocardioides sp.]|uniref:MFS transporter n=1 Tax=Nocardioides sp. TaxID=35761 RepID=UPI002E312867|nr:MFS transporter [Nocardioides sp.]HEX3930719.1 MFS transporter [Nocardioides sp.]
MSESVAAGAKVGVGGGVVASFVRETTGSLRSVFVNRDLRRLQLAFAGSLVGNWAYATAVAVWAYGVGGPKAVGIFAAVRLALMAFATPFVSTFADRYPRKRVMIFSDLYCATLISAATICLYLGTPAWSIFALAAVTSFGSSSFRAAQGALTPQLANTPDELTASNATASTLESMAIFVGPAIGAGLLTIADVEVVFLLNVASFLLSMTMVSGIRVPVRSPSPGPKPHEGDDSGEVGDVLAEAEQKAEGFVAETSAGFRTIGRDRDLLLTVLEGSAQTVLAGATAVLPLVMAVEILHTGAKGVGLLDSMSGLAAVAGGIFAISRASRHRLGQDLTTGVLLWSVPLLLVTIWPAPVMAFLVMAFLGFGNPLVDVNVFTVIQRLTPDAVLGRVFGAFETCLIATMALGSAITPVMLHEWGLRTTMAVLGLAVGAVALLGLPRMRQLDHRLEAPAGLALLQAVSMFGPLSPVTLDALARGLVRVPVAAGAVVVHEGDESDRFYIIESGTVRVTAADGHELREEGPGDHFGEIGLLRDVPRTATITAVDDVVLLALAREEFLEAVTGQGEARRLAEDVVTRRLRT